MVIVVSICIAMLLIIGFIKYLTWKLKESEKQRQMMVEDKHDDPNIISPQRFRVEMELYKEVLNKVEQLKKEPSDLEAGGN